MFGVLCPVVIFLVHVRLSPVEDHQDYQEIWEVWKESETTFTQPGDHRGNLIEFQLQRNGMVIEKMEPNFSQRCTQWKNEMQ